MDIRTAQREDNWMMEKGAQFSNCRTWRYALWRTWDASEGHVMFIGLNPSTADETADDPTVRRCIGYAKQWGYGGIYMLNLFAYRATDPKIMKAAAEPVVPKNNRFLEMYYEASGIAVACWGTHGGFQDRGGIVADMLGYLHCLGITKEGHPKHPLYLKRDLVPGIFLGYGEVE